MHVLSPLAFMGISALLSAPVDARAGPFRMIRPLNITTAASGATGIPVASNTAFVTAVHLHPTAFPTGGSSPYHNISVPYNNPTITVSHKPTATPSTPATYHNADQPGNPGYVCRTDYSQCYARAPHPADADYVKALEANDQESLDSHEKQSTLATENDDACHAEFKSCLGFGLGPVLPRNFDDKVISPRQRMGQEKHTLEQEKQASEEARIASDFSHKTIPVDAPSVREDSAVTKGQRVGFGRSPILPRSEEDLEPRAYLTEEEQKAHYKSFRLGEIPVRSGPMGVGPILPRDDSLETKKHHGKPLDIVRTTEHRGPNSGHAQGDEWRTITKRDPTASASPLSKRQAHFRPNVLPPMWEAVMHGPFDVKDVVFGEGKMIPRSLIPSPALSAVPISPPNTVYGLVARDEPDDESVTQKEYEELKKGKGKARKGKGGKKEKREETKEAGQEVPEETKRLMQGDVHKTAKGWTDFWHNFWKLCFAIKKTMGGVRQCI